MLVRFYVPEELESMMKAQTTEREKTETHVFSVYISIASVKENRVLFSAQLRILSASAAYSAFPCIISEKLIKQKYPQLLLHNILI